MEIHPLVQFVIDQGFSEKDLVDAAHLAGFTTFLPDDRAQSVQVLTASETRDLGFSAPTCLFSWKPDNQKKLCFVAVVPYQCNRVDRRLLRFGSVKQVQELNLSGRMHVSPYQDSLENGLPNLPKFVVDDPDDHDLPDEAP